MRSKRPMEWSSGSRLGGGEEQKPGAQLLPQLAPPGRLRVCGGGLDSSRIDPGGCSGPLFFGGSTEIRGGGDPCSFAGVGMLLPPFWSWCPCLELVQRETGGTPRPVSGRSRFSRGSFLLVFIQPNRKHRAHSSWLHLGRLLKQVSWTCVWGPHLWFSPMAFPFEFPFTWTAFLNLWMVTQGWVTVSGSLWSLCKEREF